jgi:inward rectifier potassium channel
MQNPTFDPGLTQRFDRPVRRIINEDGGFNVNRLGTTWRDFHPYLHLINMRWPGFLASLFLGYLVVNTVFAAAYFWLTPGQLQGANAPTGLHRFWNDFFFSAHTLTTVGYGNIAPVGLGANVLASFEALVGVLGFAVATGLLYGRVSRPSARIGFSANALIAPYQDGTSLQFRIVNRRSNSLMELDARVLLMTVEGNPAESRRAYAQLKLERPQVLFLPLTWTVVHPIDKESPLWGKSADDLVRLQAEVLILLKGYDDTFNQTVIARHSYRHDEFRWNVRFAPAFFVDPNGDLVLELRKIGEVAS